MKKFAVLLLLSLSALYGQRGPVDKARGLFIAVGVGSRLPLNSFANSTNLGYGFDIEIAYTDDEYLPLFLFSKIGFDQFPGAQQFYEVTDYSNFSTNALPISVGARYYFPPLVEKIVLFMPMVELSANYTYFQKLHQFKAASGKSNYLESISKIGFNAGAGFSMFMLEILASYTYLMTNQYVSLDLKVRLPLYIGL